jgi:hypothetical protein
MSDTSDTSTIRARRSRQVKGGWREDFLDALRRLGTVSHHLAIAALKTRELQSFVHPIPYRGTFRVSVPPLPSSADELVEPPD